MSTQADGSDAIRDLEGQRCSAMLAGNVDALTELCSPSLVYTHSDGKQDSRASYLEKVENGYFVYHSLDLEVGAVDVLADTALVHGRVRGNVDVSGQPRNLDCSYLAVWSKDEGLWKFRAFQPTPIH